MPGKLEPMPEPWEKRPDEGMEAYQAFLIYRDAGRNRSIPEVAKSVGKHPSLLWRWAREHDWRDRAALWDREIDRDFRAGLVKERIRAAKETIELGRAIRGKAAESLNALIDSNTILDAKAIPTWAELGVRLERLGMGEAITTIEINEGKDDDEQGIDNILRDKRARKLALELEELISEGQTKPPVPDDVGESEMGESGPS
jgi:hypothetical protein